MQCFLCTMGFPGGSDSKESACNEGDQSSITGSGRSPGEGNGNPLQYSCLENFMNCMVHDVAKSWHDWETLTFTFHAVCLVAQCPNLCDPMDCSPPGSSVHEDSPSQNTGVGCHALLQGIFPTQGLNPGLLYWRQILYCLSHQRSPWEPYKWYVWTLKETFQAI